MMLCTRSLFARLAGVLVTSTMFTACIVAAPPPAQGPGYAPQPTTEGAPAPAEPAPAEPAPGAEPGVPEGLREYPPVTCMGNQDIELDGVYIHSPDVAITLTGNCDITLRGSYIVGDNVAIVITGNGEVSLQDSTVQGRNGSFSITGNGEIRARHTRFIGPHGVTGNGGFQDEGGNTWQ